jgi:gamma-glutamylcyclotransferase (GGCT)/AIG2-like uncharacterized protein YtfP
MKHKAWPCNQLRPAHLFAYGTLRRALGHPMHNVLARRASLIDLGRLCGRLYDLGPYPGAIPIPSLDHTSTILGEVYALPPAHRESLLEQLDLYEGYSPFAPTSEYVREAHPVTLAGKQQTLPAWVYRYCGDVSNSAVIPEGDYVAYLRGKGRLKA